MSSLSRNSYKCSIFIRVQSRNAYVYNHPSRIKGLESQQETRVSFPDSSLELDSSHAMLESESSQVILGGDSSQVKSFGVPDSSQVKSFWLMTKSSQVKSNMRLESTRVRVRDLACYNTGKTSGLSSWPKLNEPEYSVC